VIGTQSTDRLWEEIVYIAYHLHWSLDSILELDHPTRARVIKEIADINTRLVGQDRQYAEEVAE
jgi:hypothetical protein